MNKLSQTICGLMVTAALVAGVGTASAQDLPSDSLEFAPGVFSFGSNGAEYLGSGAQAPVISLDFEGDRYGDVGIPLDDLTSQNDEISRVIEFMKLYRAAAQTGTAEEFAALFEEPQSEQIRITFGDDENRWQTFQATDQRITEYRLQSLLRYGEYWIVVGFEIYEGTFLVPRIHTVTAGRRILMTADLDTDTFIGWFRSDLGYRIGNVAAGQLGLGLGQPIEQ